MGRHVPGGRKRVDSGDSVTGSCQSLKVFDGNKDAVHFARPGRQWLWPKARLPSQLGAQASFLLHISFPCLAERKTCSWPQRQFYPVDCPCHDVPFHGLLRHTATPPLPAFKDSGFWSSGIFSAWFNIPLRCSLSVLNLLSTDTCMFDFPPLQPSQLHGLLFPRPNLSHFWQPHASPSWDDLGGLFDVDQNNKV